MLFRRQREAGLEPARRALAEGQYEQAFEMLESALRRSSGDGTVGATWLQLAALYALYGEGGLENGPSALRNAVTADPHLASHPLYQALYWEFAAYKGAGTKEVRRGLRTTAALPASTNRSPAATTVLPPEFGAMASYHSAAAFFAIDAPRSAARRLQRIEEGALPTYLAWRRYSLLGQCAELQGDWEGAAEAFAQAAALAPYQERSAERLSLAGALIELFRTAQALEELQDIDDSLLNDDELAVHRYLLGRVHLELDNPNLALSLFEEAAANDTSSEGPPYSVTFATAQALAALGRVGEAARAFKDALELAPAEHRAFTQHEAAFAMIEADELLEAEALLAEVVTNPSYPHRGEALADLADVNLRRGELESALRLAQQALELGATAPACITLGSVAFEYFHLEDAVSWFEQAVSASREGDPFWLMAQQSLADVYSQMGEKHATLLLQHAKAALKFTDPTSEWYLPLNEYVEQAKGYLGGYERILN